MVRLAAGTVVCLLLTVGMGGPASASPTDPTATSSSSRAQVGSLCSSARRSFDYQYLPVERWSGATQKIHVRSNGGIVDFAPVQRQLQSVNFVIGDFFYGLTTKLVTWSTQFCPLQAVGGAVDSAAAQLGRALVHSSLIAGLLVCTLVGLLLQGFRNRDSAWMGRIGVKLLVVALFAIMVAGSTQSRGGGIGGDFTTPYQPGRGSPGWFATTIDRIVTELAAAPAAALSAQTIVDTTSSGDQLDCGPYLGALQDGYTAQASRGGVINSEAVPALTVSNLWQISGYNAWSVGQFGNKNMNGQTRVACRMLDKNAAIPVSTGSFLIDGTDAANNRSSASITNVMSRVPQPDASPTATAAWVKPDAPAWRQLSGIEDDKAWIAWAACVPRDGQLANVTSKTGWKAPDGNAWLIADQAARANADTVDGSPKLNQACWSFFNSDTATVDPIFDWGDGDKQLRQHADQMPASVYDFISALHGTNQTAGGIASIGYVLASLGVFAVFGLMGAAILTVKIITLVMLFTVFFAMAVVLLPNADNTKLVRFTKEYLGLTLFSAFAVFMLAMVTLFVKIIWLLLGGFTGGPNSLMTMLLGGLAPVLAAIALHRAFTSIGLPSPMTVKGAVGWGRAMAGGAAGGSVVAGLGRLSVGARTLAGIGGMKLGGSALGGLKTRRAAGKANNQTTDGAQKSPTTSPGTARGAAPAEPTSAAVGRHPSPEAVLADRQASPAAKRAAQRQIAADRKAMRTEARDASTTARIQDQADQRPRLEERLTARVAGAAQVGWDATKTAAADRLLDAQRHAVDIAQHPGTAARQAARRVPKRAVGVAAVLGAATVAGLPGAAAVGGVLVAKQTTRLVRQRIRTSQLERQQALDAFRQRQQQGMTHDEAPVRAEDEWAQAVDAPFTADQKTALRGDV
ncbi:hypothetical protein GCM10022236_38920 [Microlunatus ginsengisoli]|uniref:TrbL/VirB6 plasmid conjugal transfer protein n=2 Tax=Microlunatus ginsengisoli TaxID=363863 RepID=A0ABP7AIH9_9ACTN